MKSIFIAITLMLSMVANAQEDQSLEYKIASIDAGEWVGKNDTSVKRIKELLDAAEIVYNTPKQRLADMAVQSKKMAKDKQVNVTTAELLDLALVICEVKCTDQEFAETQVSYIISRSGTGQTHHQAVHGILILKYLEKKLGQ